MILHSIQLLKLLRKNGTMKVEELAVDIGLDGRSVRRYQLSLKKAGYNIISKSGKNGGYTLVEENLEPYEWIILKELLKDNDKIYEKISRRFEVL